MKSTLGRLGASAVANLALIVMLPVQGIAQTNASATSAPATDAREPRDGQRDFDFEIGMWNTHLRRLVKPLSGSTTWVEYTGTSVVRKVMGGRANLVELDVQGPAGRIEGISLRLYNPQSRQWSLNFANIQSGTLEVPAIGEFKDGRGEFIAQDTFGGRAILVRFVVIVINADTARFEQSFSDDGGKTWELNWVATDTRYLVRPSGPPAGRR